ncbi:MAG: hypothetical protein RI907_402 [Pseudomonadota bacterium]|jgi:outer membrane biosynthesis protein TonB
MSVATMGSPMSPEPPPGSGQDKRRAALMVLAGVAVLALVGWGLSQIKLGNGPGKPRQQTVKISLPDTPPPPPPKQEEKRPEPKPDNKPVPQQQELKPQPLEQAPQPLKMEGAAGNGPSAFSSGAVTQDYKGGAVGTGSGAAVVSSDDRRKAQLYVNNIRRQLKEELERHLDTASDHMAVSFSIWVGPDGRLSRFEIVPTGDAQADADAHRAFEEAARTLRLERPGDVVQPLRMRFTLLPNG